MTLKNFVLPSFLTVGQIVPIIVERLGINGEGVGRFHNLTIFVDGALPGEVIDLRIKEVKKTYATGEIVSFLKKSPHRLVPPCSLFGRCGGCQLMHLSYEEQLVQKRQRVIDAFERIGKLSGFDVEPCVPSPSILGYRNKIQLPVLQTQEGLKLGLYARLSHDFVPVERCMIHSDLGETILQKLIYDAIKKSALL